MFYSPQSAFLKEFIQCFWFIRHDSIPLATKMLPDGYSDIMLNFGNAYSLAFNNESEIEINESVFVGQRTKTMFLNQTGDVNMIGVRLNPGKEYTFLNQSAHLVQNSVISVSQVMGEVFESYLFDIQNNNTDELRVNLTEQLFENHFRNNNAKSNTLVDFALNLIQKNVVGGQGLDLSKELNLNYKQSERLFKKHVGITPKKYIRVIRFYQAYTKIRNQKSVNWTEVLNEYNFYDQSHFIKEYHWFTGNSPNKQFRKKDTLEDVFGF
jgi:AraC-like DNA-binding protein